MSCPDLFRFFGGEECTYQNLFGSFSRYCEKVNEPFHLCGLSLGAVLALHYGICHPQKVRSMVLIAPQYQMPKRLLKIQNGIFHLLPKAAFDGMGLEKKQMICLTNSMQNLQLEEQCRRVSCPVLVLCGKKDRANQKSSVALSELLPQARMEWLKNAGHEANLDAPEELAAAIELFGGMKLPAHRVCGRDKKIDSTPPKKRKIWHCNALPKKGLLLAGPFFVWVYWLLGTRQVTWTEE